MAGPYVAKLIESKVLMSCTSDLARFGRIIKKFVHGDLRQSGG